MSRWTHSPNFPACPNILYIIASFISSMCARTEKNSALPTPASKSQAKGLLGNPPTMLVGLVCLVAPSPPALHNQIDNSQANQIIKPHLHFLQQQTSPRLRI